MGRSLVERAATVEKIFGWLSWMVLVVALLWFVTGIAWLFEDVWVGLYLMLAALVWGALGWAAVQLASIAAGYIAARAPDGAE